MSQRAGLLFPAALGLSAVAHLLDAVPVAVFPAPAA
jgi:hypothetical protein